MGAVWHIINGIWYHLVQIDNNGVRTFYTDGAKVGEYLINEKNNCLKCIGDK